MLLESMDDVSSAERISDGGVMRPYDKLEWSGYAIVMAVCCVGWCD
jgi:hypothetical protein